MKTSELIKLKVGQSFVAQRAEGPEICRISDIRVDEDHHAIFYETKGGKLASIYVRLPVIEDEELGSLSLAKNR